MNIYNEDGTKRPAPDADKIRLGQRVESAEARTGEPSAQRLLAERSVEALRAATSWEDARARVDANGDTLVITDSRDINGKVTWGGYLKDDMGRKVKLSALPKDCSYKALDKRFEGKDAQAPTKPVKAWTANAAKGAARKIFNTSSSMEEAEKRLAERGMSIERTGKTGAYLRFAEGDEGRVKLSALGGKYSLSALTKRYTSTHIITHADTMHGKQEKVNASSKESASTHAFERAEHAADRAEAAAERASDIAPSGGGEGVGDGFYDLDFIEQIKIMMGVANAQTAAHVAIMRALSQARDAEQRALEAEARARAAEMAPETRQQPEITSKTEVTQMFTPNYEKAWTAARRISDETTDVNFPDYKLVGRLLSDYDYALTGKRREYNLRDGANLANLAAVAFPECAAADFDARRVEKQYPQIRACAHVAASGMSTHDVLDENGHYPQEWLDSFRKDLSNGSTTIDKPTNEKSGAAVGKASEQTGLKIEKPANMASEQEKPARRKFSFGGLVGKFGGGNKGSAPATGPKA